MLTRKDHRQQRTFGRSFEKERLIAASLAWLVGHADGHAHGGHGCFIVIAIPSIRAGLGASVAEIELVVAGYGLTYAVALLTGGRLGDL